MLAAGVMRLGGLDCFGIAQGGGQGQLVFQADLFDPAAGRQPCFTVASSALSAGNDVMIAAFGKFR